MTATMPFPRFSDAIDFDKGWPIITEFETPNLGRLERLIDWYEVGHAFNDIYDSIPAILRAEKRWIWLEKSSVTDVIKAPYLCRGVELADALSAKNQIRFSPPEGPTFHRCGAAFVLDGGTLAHTGLVPVAIEIRANGKHDAGSALRLWQCLGRPYFEFSADGKGWIIIGLCQGGVPTIERDGIRISTAGGYVELFGLGGRGDLKDISRELDVLMNGALPASPPTKTIPCLLAASAEPRTPRKLARLRQALSHISADCEYGLYRDIVWGVLSTGWPDAEEIARQWCMSAPSRFQEKSFRSVVASFNPALADRPRLGTVFYHAKEGGWGG